MRRSDSIREVARADARKALTLAYELVASSEASTAVGHWRAAGLTAIHAGISAADAALAAAAGVRSASQDHAAVVELLASRVPDFGTAQKRQIAGLLKEKNAIAYEQRSVTESEARVMLDQSKRFVAWASVVVDKSLR